MESVRSSNEVATPRLSAEAVAVLHAALENAPADRAPTASSALQRALQRICVDAKRSDWPPERLLIAFKAALYGLPVMQRLPRGPDRDEFVAHLVSRCIGEYYLGPQRSADAQLTAKR